MYGHRGPVSSLAMQHDEKGYFSAGWDGDVYVSALLLHLYFILDFADSVGSNGI